ncbi:pre-mRNA cleavage complex II protein Clp1 [Metarhizium guizhouense ARSEF 977]|uniref:Polynucleotide 5'-hydroxyl-kinase GRC3 n=1 Tax=Metarhizium guizhouense (strain ARSEF 977) TaxID=1276136 RepID=A0A0B4I5P2_METGA|nr:pre-mRNA cleavage complex II protein Clp1 [Metarhizium guizhouense ARSEF 977]
MQPARDVPRFDQLQDYPHAVAGHAGTLCDSDGQVFVKPCTQAEIDFYELTKSEYPDFADLMPLHIGNLVLSGPREMDIGDIGDGLQTDPEQVLATIQEQVANAARESQTEDTITWVPSQGKKIQTNMSVVLENQTNGFKRPNVLDVKLGTRLYADDAPKQKQERFQQISKETTHHNLGFRIAGMRVFRGSQDPSELDDREYKNYDKDYGRFTVNDDNVVNELRRFIFNEAAGIDEDLGKAICATFARELGTIIDVMSGHEIRTYSSSLLFVYEGDGEALKDAIRLNTEYAKRSTGPPATKRIDSGIGLDDEDQALEQLPPPVLKLKLIDFAHATWTPGSGPDENTIKGTVHSSTRIIVLKPSWEWRFEVPAGRKITVKVLSGTAEKDGVELALRNAYSFSAIKSKILTWHGCELEVDGRTDDEFVAEYASPVANPANAYVNLHARLNEMRTAAVYERREGPRVLIAGPPTTGKTTLVRTLASYATRQGFEPIVVNADPKEGMLSLPGTLSASVFATVMDPEAVDGWGTTPTSGPSTVPVKLPLVYYYGRNLPDDDPEFYRELTSKIAGTVSGRLSEDEAVKSSGVIVDSMGVSEKSKIGEDLLAHIVDELSINIIVVLGSNRMTAELSKRFSTERTSLGEPIQIVGLDRSEGVVERDEGFLEYSREQAIKEYFFGDARRALSPQIQHTDFDALVIYKASDYSAYEKATLSRNEPSSVMQHWTLAVMHASPKDPPEVVRAAAVMGFVYVSDVDEDRRKIKLLAPVGGRLGDRPLILGSWPEPYINLLG